MNKSVIVHNTGKQTALHHRFKEDQLPEVRQAPKIALIMMFIIYKVILTVCHVVHTICLLKGSKFV